MTNLSPAQKRIRVRQSFEAKVRILENWAEFGAPDGVAIPTTRTALRRWKDEAADLTPWSDDQVDDPNGRNSELYLRYVAALELIQLWRSTSKPARIGRLQHDVKRLEQTVRTLTLQNANLLGRLAALESENSQLLAQLDGRRRR